MPNAIAGEESGDSYSFTVTGQSDDVVDYYAQQLPPKGWTILAVGESANGGRLAIFTKGSDILSISISIANPLEQLLLVLLVMS